MMIEQITRGDRELVATLATFPQRFHARLVRVMDRLGVQLQNKVKSEKLSGQVLKTGLTGHLRNSIGEETVADAGGITTRVGVFKGPTLEYARAHEFGAVIRPKRAKFLTIPVTDAARQAGSPRNFPGKLFFAFTTGGKANYFQGGQPVLAREQGGDALQVEYLLRKSVTLPKRAFLSTALAEFADTIVTTLDHELTEATSA